MKNRSNFIIAIGTLVLIILFTSFTSIINFVTDYKWFSELGYTQTFLTKLLTQFKIGIPIFIVVFLLIKLYLSSIKKGYYKHAKILVSKEGEKRLNISFTLTSVIIALFMARSFASNLWFTVLQYINSTEFNISDPIFNNDISFYMFKLPLFNELLGLVVILAFILIIITVAFYMVMLVIRKPSSGSGFDMGELAERRNIPPVFNKKVLKEALIHIGVFGLIILIVIGVSYLLKSYNLVYSTRGKVNGASYTDIHVTLVMYRILAVTALISAIGVLIGSIKKNLKLALAGPALLIIISIIGGIASGIVQEYIVKPNEIGKESKYLKYDIEYTQKAYGLENINEVEFPVEQELTKDDILNNEETIKNIRINDYRPVNQVYYQLQGIRPYYEFNDIDIDRYNIDGEYTQVFLSAREINQQKLNEDAKTWQNQHLKYTHGYGVVLSPVNSVTEEGQPRLLVKNIPPVTDTDFKITRPEIYFGELTNNYIVVNTEEKEFDYSQGEDNAETMYEGTAGISLNGINKLLFSIKQGSTKILLSGAVNDDSKIILYRNIKERVKKIAPFITYDKDPYLVVNQEDGKLYWIIDGYTMSDKYPYSKPYKDTKINYIRNSVKVVVDAYNGDTKYYIFDEEDPIIKTYRMIFPDLFLDKGDMPEGIKEHIRYPQLIFDIQSEIYRLYHINNTGVFYNKEDVWDIAKEKYMAIAEAQTVESNYVMFKLPDEEEAEFLLTAPYTPSGKNNMISIFVARNDRDNYGKLFIYKFPKEKNIEGPMLIENRIDQDDEISQDLTLWGQKGSTVLRGNLLVVPIEESLLYIEPIYLQADNEGSLPEVKRVIVAYKGKIVMKNTLGEALSDIFGALAEEKLEEVEEITENDNIVIDDDNLQELIAKANEAFDKAQEALQKGEWGTYGEHMKEIEDILNVLEQSTKVEDIEE